jgi:hypothetical protein
MRGFPPGRTEALRTHFCNDEKHVAATVAGLSGCHMFASIFKATTFYDYLSSAMARVFHIPCHPVVHRCLPSNRPSLTQKPYISPVQPLHASRCTSPWPPLVSFHVALLPDRSMSQVQHLIEVCTHDLSSYGNPNSPPTLLIDASHQASAEILVPAIQDAITSKPFDASCSMASLSSFPLGSFGYSVLNFGRLFISPDPVLAFCSCTSAT